MSTVLSNDPGCAPKFDFGSTRIAMHRCIAQGHLATHGRGTRVGSQNSTRPIFYDTYRGPNRSIDRSSARYVRSAFGPKRATTRRSAWSTPSKENSLKPCRNAWLATQVELWGPLGNGFSTEPTDHLILVAGGVGQTPMLTLASAALGKSSYGSPSQPNGYAKKVTLCYGARTKAYLAGIPDFEKACSEVRIATDDGSQGHHGRVTDLLRTF